VESVSVRGLIVGSACLFTARPPDLTVEDRDLSLSQYSETHPSELMSFSVTQESSPAENPFQRIRYSKRSGVTMGTWSIPRAMPFLG
jgi:hypothetical protein